MRLGVGLDLCDIERIEKLMENDRFLEKYFSEREQEYFKNHGFRAESIAAGFSAKEAFSKAVGTGVSGFSLKEVEVLHNAAGKPYLEFQGRAEELVEREGLLFDVSLTHTESSAAAVVICFKEAEQ